MRRSAVGALDMLIFSQPVLEPSYPHRGTRLHAGKTPEIAQQRGIPSAGRLKPAVGIDQSRPHGDIARPFLQECQRRRQHPITDDAFSVALRINEEGQDILFQGGHPLCEGTIVFGLVDALIFLACNEGLHVGTQWF